MLDTQKQQQMKYHRSIGFDEKFAGPDLVRSHYRGVHERLQAMSEEELNGRNASMQSHLVKQGVTFTLERHPDSRIFIKIDN
jgi:uncharacterized circularly permuted ATP-grasp superfamily protein